MQTSEKLLLLRNKLEILGLDACIIPSADPHLSEYLSDHWKVREWLSNFTGSAGTLVVTAEEAALWTDSRYYIQAEDELDEQSIILFKDGEPGVPGYPEWLCEVLMPGNKVCVNGSALSVNQVRTLTRKFRDAKIQLETGYAPAEEIWDIRPPIPEDTVFLHKDIWNGKTRAEKLEDVRAAMEKEGVTHFITAALDEIAWVLNLRGSDIPFNPVFHAYLIIEHDQAKLFINPHKLTASIAQKLTADEVKVYVYDRIFSHLKDISKDSYFYIDPNRTNSAIYNTISQKFQKKEGQSIIASLKTIKHSIEIENFRNTLKEDGIAMVHFLKWLEDNVSAGKVTEMSAASKLKAFRAERPDFYGESFATISAYEEHGAIVHYTADESSNSTLKPKGIYLLDSGGQYPGGTTDITRTIALGEVSDQAKVDFTLVLKGHIALAIAIFPQGTRGVHLDILARKPLLENGCNYGHGTGHGIGYFLNVHEGPQAIRPQDNGVEMKAGMITSNEPGLYRKNKYGIRTENLILCVEKMSTEFGCFLGFETITLCPIDISLLNTSLLTREETEWLNNYHKKVFESLASDLDTDHADWLKQKTAPIGSV
jgi:Xaa-Pro aminopeptidase